jgi:hypothetical protein
MITLTTPITVEYNINNLRKFEVLTVHDDNKSTPKVFNVELAVYGLNSKQYGNRIWVRAVETGNSTCLRVSATPTGLCDQLETHQAEVANAYATLSDAFWLRTGSYNARKAGIESLLVGTLLSSAFAGT